jgi:hypothetical protein
MLMAYKHQSHCYRNIGGVRYENIADLIYAAEESDHIEREARSDYKKVRIILHKDGFYQLFVTNRR